MTPLDGIRYLPQEDEQLTEIHVEIRGPENTPYEGGFFKLKLVLSDGFPHAPPKGFFLTKIFHPNIATNGDICVNTLKKDWSPTLGIAHVLQVIRCLLIVPFPESSLNDEAGRLFMDSYDEYARRARIWTNIHAPKESASAKTDQERSSAQDSAATDTAADSNGSAKTATDKTGGDDASASGSSDSAAAETASKCADTAPATPVKPAEASDAPAVAVPEPQTISAPSSAKKRTSSNATDIAASLKKKNVKKKGIKRL